MMTFSQLLHEKKDAIIRRWLASALAVYAEDSSARFQRQQDPFANPVGHSLREGTRTIFEALLAGGDGQAAGRHLQEIVKIRAVQEFSPSQALAFIFRLKEAVRAELAEAGADGRFAAQLAELDGRVDGLALAAFDIFVQCREQVCELRVNEANRRVSWIVAQLNKRNVRHEREA